MSKMTLIFIVVLSLSYGCVGRRAAMSGMMQRALTDEMQESQKLIGRGQLRQAVDELSMLLELNPEDTQSRFLRALAHQKLEEFEAAASDYHTLITQEPQALKAHYNLGMIYAFKLGKPAQALQHFDQFLSLDPTHEQAQAVARLIASMDGGSGSTLDLQSQVDRAMAERDLPLRRDQLLELGDVNASPIPYYLVGQSYDSEGKRKDAEHYYRLALECRPSCAPCHEALGRTLIASKKKQEGELHLQKAKLFKTP